MKESVKTTLARRLFAALEASGLSLDEIVKLCDTPDKLRLAADTLRTIAETEADMFVRQLDPAVIQGRVRNLLRGEGIICNADLALRSVIELNSIRHFNKGTVGTLLRYLETLGMRPRSEHEPPAARLLMMFPDARQAPISCLTAFGASPAGVRTLMEAKLLRIHQLIAITQGELVDYLDRDFLSTSPAVFPSIVKGLKALGLHLART